MRIYKFRVWDGERMYLWNTLLGNDFTTEQMFSPDTPTWEVMQFTGLLDKNGKEIYEGDLVRTESWNKLRVEFDYDQWGLFDGICNEASIDENVEIIGNVYESEEL